MPQKILVVEDTSDILLALHEALEGEGFTVISAMDMSTAKSLIESNALDLAVVDLLLPDGNGSDLCKEITGKWGAPVIIFTVEDTREVVLNCLEESGAVDYVLKGTGVDELLHRVKKHLAAPGELSA